MKLNLGHDRSLRGIGLGIGLIATAVVFAAGYALQAVVLPVLLSYLLSVFLEPFVAYLEKWRWPRSLSATLCVTLVVGCSALSAWGVYSTCERLANQIPQYSDKIKSIVSSFQEGAEQIAKNSQSLMPDTKEKEDVQKVKVIESFSGNKATAILSGVNSGFELITIAFFIPLLALFFLLDKPFLARHLKNALTSPEQLDQISVEVSQMLRSFLLGNLVVGLLTAAGFYGLFGLLGLQDRLPLAVFAGFINLIPVVGSILGGLLPALQALMQFDTLAPMAVVMGGSVFLHFFIANIIMPKIVGSRINVNSSAATLGLLFWGWLWGAAGLFLAIPLTALVRIFLSANPSTKPWALLVAEKESTTASQSRADVDMISPRSHEVGREQEYF